jgi:crossover junction endonuclease MUS81
MSLFAFLFLDEHSQRESANSTNATRLPSGSSKKPTPSCDLDLDSDSETSATPHLRAESTQLGHTSKRSNRAQRAPNRPRISESIPAPLATSDIEPESDVQPGSAPERNAPLFAPFEPLIFPAGSYSIQLVLDEREIKSTRNRDYMLDHLKKRGINAVKRSLEVGDVCWVARLNDDSSQECVLDFIIERKRMDDLKGSILDGRFHEQKVSIIGRLCNEAT